MKFPELSALYHQPFFDLISRSRAVHLQHWRGEEVQRCSLLSIKTGGCSEDCAYFLTAKNLATDVDVALLSELGLHVESMTNDECLMTKE